MESSKPTTANQHIRSAACASGASPNAGIRGELPSHLEMVANGLAPSSATAVCSGMQEAGTAVGILRELYPHASTGWAREFLDQFEFPAGERSEYELRLARELRQDGDIPPWATEYLLNALFPGPRRATIVPDGEISMGQSFHDYEVPQELRETIGKALLHRKAPGDLSPAEASLLRDLTQRLWADAKSNIERATFPEAPVMPRLKRETPLQDVIAAVFNCSRGMVIQDGGADIGSKLFLIESMGTLAGQGARTLFLNNLSTEFHQDALDDFSETGQMTEDLKSYLDALDENNKSGQGQKYTFCGLVEAARAHGLKPIATGAVVTLYYDKDDPDQMKMQSYLSSQVINAHQQANGGQKWVALEYRPHSASDNNSVPGIAELQGAIYIPSGVF